MRNKSHNSMKTSLHSSYWLDDFSIGSFKKRSELDPIQLAKYQKVVSNFVQILTKKHIPVQYSSSGDSYTDSKTVTIGSNISEKTLDSVVGLALHEGSHIKLTDFTILPNLISKIRELGYDDFVDSLPLPLTTESGEMIRGILNYIEDRRIDYYVYTTSPGYKNYYKALYDRYFNHASISKGLKSNQYRDSNDIESYIFRIINFTNPNSDLNALPGLREIYNLIFSNIRNLESTMDSLNIAVQVCKIILDNVNTDTDQSESNDSNDENSESGGGSGKSASGEESSDSGENSPSNEGEGGEGSSQSDDSSDGEGDSDELKELSNRQQQQLQKDIQKQKDFLNGNVSKRSVTKKLKGEIIAVSQSNISVVDVTCDQKLYNGEIIDKNYEVIVIRGLNENTLNVLEYFKRRYGSYVSGLCRGSVDNTDSVVASGISLGKKLGKKLQIRNYESNTTINRQKRGRLERRRLHAIGADDFNVFYQVQTEKYTDAFLHLSIDGSGSMSGNNFLNSLKSAVAIAQMGSMTNIDVQISLRVTETIGGTEFPIMWVVYDSRKDTMATIKKYFKFLDTCGSTPEGLCFDSIMKELPVGNDSLKTYFINYSDGEPYFKSYYGESALNHTRKQVNKMKENGYRVLSFFITDYSNSSVSSNFKKMYGEDSRNIDPTSLPSLASTLQKMFIKNK